MQNGILSETINNAIIQIGDIDDTGKGRHFVSRFIKDGLVKIEGHGIVLLKKETLDASLPSMVGTPVIIQHQNVTKSNADKLRIGTISNAYFNEPDGWYYCEGIIWDDEAKDLIDKGWSVSCSYDFLAYNDEGGVENNIKYDKEFTQLNFTHLAIVDNPRYERANIVFNSKEEEKGQWITIKGNHIFIPDGKTLDEVIKEKNWGNKENKQSDTKDKQEPEWLQREKQKLDRQTTQMYEDRYSIEHPETYKKNLEGTKDKQPDIKGDSKDDELVNVTEDYYNRISKEELQKEFKDIQKEFAKWKDKKNFPEYKGYKNKLLRIKDIYEKRFGKSKVNNSKEKDMLLEELKKLIFKVENSKENDEMIDNEKVDKRKLIDEVAGIMKSAGCDDEDIRMAIGKMEKIGYDKSEDGSADNKKVKNEEPDKKDDVDNKKVKNEDDDKKVDNEDAEDEKKVDELKKEEKEDVDNKCKNSKSSFDKINEIFNSVKQISEEKTYVSRQEKLDNAVEYFK